MDEARQGIAFLHSKPALLQIESLQRLSNTTGGGGKMSMKAAPFFTAVALLAIVSCCPVITKIAPEQGRYGTEVVISGERFENTPSDNTVTFGGVSVPTPDIHHAQGQSPCRRPIRVCARFHRLL